MDKRSRRQKAPDVAAERNYPFRKKGTFRQAFPAIRILTAKVKESGEGVTQSTAERIFNADSLPSEYMDSHNPLRWNGGLAIGSVIRNTVAARQGQAKVEQLCQGQEGSSKGRQVYDRCLNMFDIDIDISYKDE